MWLTGILFCPAVLLPPGDDVEDEVTNAFRDVTTEDATACGDVSSEVDDVIIGRSGRGVDRLQGKNFVTFCTSSIQN